MAAGSRVLETERPKSARDRALLIALAELERIGSLGDTPIAEQARDAAARVRTLVPEIG